MSQFDETLANQIKDRFRADSRIDPYKITIEANNGAIVLSGTVPSVTAYNAAEATAWAFYGVISVRNNLKIIFPENFKKPSDSVVADNLRQLLSWDPELYLESITISIENTSIFLKGSVGSFYKKFHAGELAKNSTSIFTIRNELAVVPTSNTSDLTVAQSITKSIDYYAIANINNLAVEVQNGHVILRGTTPNQTSYDAVEDIARYTDGVVDIDNRLTIAETL